VAVWLATLWLDMAWVAPVAGVAAVVGHCWSLYVGFSGGMGLAVITGPVVLHQPVLPFLAAGIWGLVYLVVRDRPRSVIIMSVVMTLVFGLAGYVGYLTPQATLLGTAGLGVIVVRHLTELRRYDERAAAAAASIQGQPHPSG